MMMGDPAVRIRRRQRTRALARDLATELQRRLPTVPIEWEAITDAPVDTEDGTLIVRTDGVSILTVLGIARDLAARIAGAEEGIRIVPRVWPRTIWCARGGGPAPRRLSRADLNPAAQPWSGRDDRGNYLVCRDSGHDGEHLWQYSEVMDGNGSTDQT